MHNLTVNYRAVGDMALGPIIGWVSVDDIET
jgi:hypothetical protein